MHRCTHLLVGCLILVLLAACSPATFGAQGTPVPTFERLPTVTPVQPTTRAVAQEMAATPLPTIVLPSPTSTPAVILSDEGPVTPSMAQLQLGGEIYAAMGDPEAPITIVEFSDFGCPSCRMYHLRTFSELKTAYIDTGKVYYVYKDFPIVSVKGDLAAQAAECAGDQDRYWEMHHELFYREVAAWNESTEAALAMFRGIAAEIDIDAAELEQCIVTGRYEDDIARDFEEAQNLRLFGTPAFFINGKLLSGAQPIDVFDEVLSEELAVQ